MSLSDEEIDRITEKMTAKVKQSHHDYWNDPETHYRQHIALESLTPEIVTTLVGMVKDYSRARGWFWKVFISLFAAGVSVIAAIGWMKGGNGPH